jgi:AcrR family transcriptional regulator
VITHVAEHELSRSTVLSMLASDAQDAREQRAREEYAGQQREQVVARAETYYREHGEWEWETRACEADIAARAEAVREEKRRAELARQREEYVTRLLMEGHRPRTISEILAAVAGVVLWTAWTCCSPATGRRWRAWLSGSAATTRGVRGGRRTG